MDFSLNLTNYEEHPTNNKYYVFNFRVIERANYFENLLIEHKIEFEKDQETTENGTLFLFGIHKKDLKQSIYLNNLTIGNFRKPFIADKFFRYFVLAVGLGAILLGVVGFIVTH